MGGPQDRGMLEIGLPGWHVWGLQAEITTSAYSWLVTVGL